MLINFLNKRANGPYDALIMCRKVALFFASVASGFSGVAVGAEARDCSHVALSFAAKSDLRLWRNEIYARRGMFFSAPDLIQYFTKTSWYRPSKSFSFSGVPKSERLCAQRMKFWEHAGAVLWKATVDLDGDKKLDSIIHVLNEPVVARPEGECKVDDRGLIECAQDAPQIEAKTTLFINDAQIVESYSWRGKPELFVKHQVLDVNSTDGHKEILTVQLYDEADDTMGSRSTIYSLIDGKVVISDFPGGEFRNGRSLSDSTTCGQRTQIWYQMKRGKIVVLREKVSKVPTSGACAACPFVDVWDGQRWVRQGEILRRIVGGAAKTWQSLPLKMKLPRDELVIRLSEEKREVTFLDSVVLEVNGQLLQPTACDHHVEAYCADDDRDEDLSEGETLVLRFHLPPDSIGGRLWAHGYYVPKP